jgi:hypothetical protein
MFQYVPTTGSGPEVDLNVTVRVEASAERARFPLAVQILCALLNGAFRGTFI